MQLERFEEITKTAKYCCHNRKLASTEEWSYQLSCSNGHKSDTSSGHFTENVAHIHNWFQDKRKPESDTTHLDRDAIEPCFLQYLLQYKMIGEREN